MGECSVIRDKFGRTNSWRAQMRPERALRLFPRAHSTSWIRVILTRQNMRASMSFARLVGISDILEGCVAHRALTWARSSAAASCVKLRLRSHPWRHISGPLNNLVCHSVFPWNSLSSFVHGEPEAILPSNLEPWSGVLPSPSACRPYFFIFIKKPGRYLCLDFYKE